MPSLVHYVFVRLAIGFGIGASSVLILTAFSISIFGNLRSWLEIALMGAPWESLQYYPLRDFWRDGKQMISA